MTIFEKRFNCIEKYFKTTIAAGGIVYVNNEILLIKRRGVWDLPKGKRDKNETLEQCAIREISEECGVQKPVIEKKLTITVYTYKTGRKNKKKSKQVLKIVHWFVLKLEKKQKTRPQVKEDIEQVKWVDIKEAEKRLENSYPTIREVFKEFVKYINS